MTWRAVLRIWWLVVGCVVATAGCNGGLRGPLPDAGGITGRDGTADGGDAGQAPGDAPVEGTGRDVAEDPHASAGDAVEDSVPTDVATEVAPPPPRCDVTHPFGTAYLLGGTQGDEEGARFAADELTMYSFSVSDDGIFVSTRSTRTSPFGPRRVISSLGSAALEAWPSLTADRLTLFFEGDAALTSVFFARRSTVDADFSPAAAIGNLDSLCFNGQPYMQPDQTFYFVNDCDGSPDIYVGAFDARTSQLTGATKLAGVNTDHLEYLPTLPADGLSIYFASDRAVPDVPGSLDIWMSTRSSTADDFGPPVSVAEVNTYGNNEVPTWASPDNCRLYFQRQRNGSQLFVAERAP